MTKRHTIAEKIKMCEKAIFAEKEGVSIIKTAKELVFAQLKLCVVSDF